MTAHGISTSSTRRLLTDPAISENVSSTVNTAYTWGFVVQAAYLIPDTKWEPFARYAFVNFDNALISPAVSNETSEITLGVNYYFAGQAAKFTFDVGYLPNGSTTNTDGSGILINSDNEFYVRGQFQLLL